MRIEFTPTPEQVRFFLILLAIGLGLTHQDLLLLVGL